MTITPKYFESTGELALVDGTLRFDYKQIKSEELFWMDNQAVALMGYNILHMLTIHGGFPLNMSPEILAEIQALQKIPSNLATVTEHDDYYLYEFTIRIAILESRLNDFLDSLGLSSPDWTATRPEDEAEG